MSHPQHHRPKPGGRRDGPPLSCRDAMSPPCSFAGTAWEPRVTCGPSGPVQPFRGQGQALWVSEASTASSVPSSGGHRGQSVSVAVVQVVSCTEHLAERVSQGHPPPGTELNLPEKRVCSAHSHRAPCGSAAAQPGEPLRILGGNPERGWKAQRRGKAALWGQRRAEVEGGPGEV